MTTRNAELSLWFNQFAHAPPHTLSRSHDGKPGSAGILAGVVFLTFSAVLAGKDASAPRFWDKL